MERKLTIRIKRRTKSECLMLFIILLPFCLGATDYILKLPYGIRYLLDVAWVILSVMMLASRQLFKNKDIAKIALWTSAFLTITILVYIVQYQSAMYYLWGFRNLFRFYAAFFAFSIFLKEGMVNNILAMFEKLFWLNAVVSLVQFFFLGMSWDGLGGLFGAESGVNAYTNIFFLIITSKSMVFYLEKKEKGWLCAAKCVVSLAIAAMAEIKFYFIEFLLVVTVAVMLTNFTWRKFWILLGGLSAVTVCAALLGVIFPQSDGFLSLDFFYEIASDNKGYTSSGDLNRLTAIPRINELWLTNWGQRLFGLGLGNCDTSNFALVNTPFYERYGHMHYTWMSYAIMYLECGWVGLIFYFGFFVLVYFAIQKIEKRSVGTAKSYCRISKIMAICCPLIAVYNSSLRMESAYMAYFILAIPFAVDRENSRRKL